MATGHIKFKEEGKNSLLRLLKSPDRLSYTLRAASIFIRTGIAVICSYWLYGIFHFTQYPFASFLGLLLLSGLLIWAFGELIPRICPIRMQEKIALWEAKPLLCLTWLLRPLSSLMQKASAGNAAKSGLSMEQLSKALEYTEDEELHEEKGMLEGIVRFSNISAIDIIQPRINIIALDIEDDFETIKNTVIQSGYSRMPVFREDLDSIEGILYVKDLLAYLQESGNFQWQSLIRPAYFVPETKKIDDLLEEFQVKKVHMAIVVDEYGGTTGIITMEDIIEEIVGDIQDEYDEQEIVYTQDKEGSYVFEASTLLNDFYKITDTDEETFEEVEGDADTLAGLILEIKGELPQKDEIITYHEHQFKILEVDNRRIKKIKYRKLTPTEEEKGNSENTENTDTK